MFETIKNVRLHLNNDTLKKNEQEKMVENSMNKKFINNSKQSSANIEHSKTEGENIL
jgi:S-adenosylmethionine:tRNA-ribosyltransferase-isomerase (queuine synthetase)